MVLRAALGNVDGIWNGHRGGIGPYGGAIADHRHKGYQETQKKTHHPIACPDR